MSAILLFSACLTVSILADALNLPSEQDAMEPLNLLSPSNQILPELNYENRLEESNLQTLEHSPSNCPNLKVLQNILYLLKRLIEQDSDLQFLQPDKKLQVLTYIKKQIERSGTNNVDNNLDMAQPIANTNQPLIPNITSNRALYQQLNNANPNIDPKIEAQLLLKYTIPSTTNAGCKEVLAALIQAVNTAHSQLVNFCKVSGKCNVADTAGAPNVQLKDLPNILNEIISTSQPQAPQPQIPSAKSNPFNIYDIKSPAQPANNLNNDAPKKDLYNDYLTQLTQSNNLNAIKNKQETVANVLNNISDETKMKILQNLLKFQQNKEVNSLDSGNKLSFGNLLKLYQVLKDRSMSVAAANQLNTFNYNLRNPLQSYNIPQKVLQPNPSITGNAALNPLIYNLPRNDKTNQLFNPTFNIQENNELSSMISSLNNLNLNPNEAKGIGNQYLMNPSVRLNPSEHQYFADYLNREIHGNTLLDSQRSESVSNLLKLNSAIDNNGVVELTYKLKHPQSLLKSYDNTYYYVKYRMPYQAFMSKVLELLRNPQLRSNPAKLYEELLSVSNVVESSPDLKDVGNNDLTKVITNDGGSLVSAKVLSTNSPLDDEYIKTLQNLNANLKTNDIVNLVNKENINKGPTPILGLNDVTLQNADKLLVQNLGKDGMSEIVSPVQTSENLLTASARKRMMYPMNFVPRPPQNAPNPHVMYNTLLNAQSYSPFTFQATQPPKYLLG